MTSASPFAPVRSLRSGTAFALALWAALAPARAESSNRAEIAINVSMTAQGRAVPRPTPETPVYYVPIVVGFQEKGRVIAGEKAPEPEEVLKQLQQALAREGYRFSLDIKQHPPTLLLAFEWGYLNPLIGEVGVDVTTATESSAGEMTTVNLTAREMLQLVAGEDTTKMQGMPSAVLDRIFQAANDDRYFMVVTAFDLDAARRNEKKLLWRARMSTMRDGVWLPEVIPAFLAAGAPHFGRETGLPAWKTFPIREGKVILHELQVLDSAVTLPTAPPKAPPHPPQ